jgi:hypothetical protein
MRSVLVWAMLGVAAVFSLPPAVPGGVEEGPRS